MMRWYGMGVGAWLGMGVFWLLLVALIVWIVVQLARPRRDEPARSLVAPGPRWAGPMPAGPGYAESPFEILDRRLATGEIDLAAYQQLRAAIFESRGGQS